MHFIFTRWILKTLITSTIDILKVQTRRKQDKLNVAVFHSKVISL
jgi:hypothetical protein